MAGILQFVCVALRIPCNFRFSRISFQRNILRNKSERKELLLGTTNVNS